MHKIAYILAGISSISLLTSPSMSKVKIDDLQNENTYSRNFCHLSHKFDQPYDKLEYISGYFSTTIHGTYIENKICDNETMLVRFADESTVNSRITDLKNILFDYSEGKISGRISCICSGHVRQTQGTSVFEISDIKVINITWSK